MTSGQDESVLTVDSSVVHKVDTANPANLYSMWTVFSRCADSVEQGRRLENLSWRLWQKEQLVEGAEKKLTAPNTIVHPQNIPSEPRLPEVPQLSGSVESAEEEEAVEITSVSAPLGIIRPRIRRQDSSTSAGRRLVRSDDFEKMMTSIIRDKSPLSAPISAPTQPAALANISKAMPLGQPAFERSGSTTTESQSPSKTSDGHSDADSQPSPRPKPRTTTVVRGFSPSQAPIPPTVQPTTLAPEASIPEPRSSPASKPVQTKKPAMFALGASYSSSEQSQSIETRQPPAFFARKPMFKIGVSSEEEGSVKGALQSARSGSLITRQKKQTSFSNDVVTRTIEPDTNAIDSDSEGDYVDESAIDDDDDSSDWEDSLEDSGKSSVDDKFFQRVDSKANLTSRRSLITLMLERNERANNLGNQASQSTSAIPRARNGPQGASLGASPNDSDEAPLMMKGARQPSTLKPISEVPRSSAQPINVPAQTQYGGQAALSPRTTRRNMLATELTESLRRHLLWERQQKSSTANAVLRRRHTSQDVANLRQYPDKACMKSSEDEDANTWNQYFSKDQFNGYHSKGW